MSTIRVNLPDGSPKELEAGQNALDLAKSLGPRLAKAAMGAEINGEVKSLTTPLADGDTVAILTFDTEGGKDVFRHSASHVMASAILRVRPEAKLAIGPPIEDGFYYDIDADPPLTEEDFAAIESEMEKTVRADYPFERGEWSKDEALAHYERAGNPYKVELIRDLDDGTITYYRHDDFVDLCRGPHLPSTGKIKAFKLLSVAGAYWRGDERRPMLQRIYGTAFPSQKELDEHLRLLAEAERRDHRKLGKQLDLFSFHPEGPGFPFFHAKGMIVLNQLMEFWREEHRKRQYGEVRTPIILERKLWEQSGHWDHYKENMYFTQIDERDFAVKPMNCPGGMLIYKATLHSYRDFPLRLAEVGTVHRHEKSGVLHGLFRVRVFTQDDAHIFMTPDQIQDEVIGIIDFVDAVYKVFGLEYAVELSTRPEKSIGTDEMWDLATSALRNALDTKGIAYKLNEGDGAFYGPKIDFHVRDCLKRSWQCATIQLDFAMPEKFDLDYVGPDGNLHRPAVIHRVIYGAIERFLAVLIEHFGGAFPTWLAPVQCVVIPISDGQNAYACQVRDRLFEAGLRVEADLSDDTMKYKIRAAQTQQVPYMLVVGDRERESGAVSVRHRRKGDLGAMPLDAFVSRIQEEIALKALDDAVEAL
ncbi:MAG TPA: threonine--tRNA ligase [Candidatus Hydrogenedentes bacterium]|nr:threonine--tRNA ligase [Candidatus Hydrogenedentota bacterium]HOH33685.1 threonine--tRNA ligase [Candidatus Hydrogenedentota bacterium]HPA06373.1 threonine--tRNA ligase [Candidatus Hydrogenedentota bacterium]HPV38530.1 threonine--tRNA ligase [Candidatus Hydrogenedentota bacterium]HQM32166.1 threonine--tRNA ligase [Candidatus Hydrogenedentota bacterium]